MVEPIKTFKGLSIRPCDAFKNISLITETASLLSAVDDDGYREISDVLFAFVCNYADEARKNESEKLK
ncbi:MULTISPECIES: hypothetical protein [Citrobacter]|uniref:Uncharacterized protein n=1 Tax=Citrobacter amalonaticus Y19 TaxID=1261127 RepID=A0A0F6TVD9_CITAM|nr:MULTISPECIES: hypothetical protein [Citrobacter]AKE59036.1 hypothetical protein F384_10780 [Citrobacter amalonaticus Y19]AUZ65765.1 hypothetical protein C2U53_19110 [Citrobacter sp. CFNIH10]AUZ66775.1 hypothetical protein C2U53_24660 [Citrobacter sp. CFNIH10]MDB2181688.1 hypothetical protein [Citrobacter farmeri]QZE48309.1 hypothetical protein Cf24236_3581 [Citrobacter farmeri]